MTSVVARYVAASTAIADDEEHGRDEPPVEAENQDDHRDDREDRARLREVRSHPGQIGTDWRALLGQPVDDVVVPASEGSGEHHLDEQQTGRDRGQCERHVADAPARSQRRPQDARPANRSARRSAMLSGGARNSGASRPSLPPPSTVATDDWGSPACKRSNWASSPSGRALSAAPFLITGIKYPVRRQTNPDGSVRPWPAGSADGRAPPRPRRSAAGARTSAAGTRASSRGRRPRKRPPGPASR